MYTKLSMDMEKGVIRQREYAWEKSSGDVKVANSTFLVPNPASKELGNQHFYIANKKKGEECANEKFWVSIHRSPASHLTLRK